MGVNGRPQYVRVKNWKTWQHYKDREPPWVKLHARLLTDDGFGGLSEADQWQLVRIWLVAANASKYTLDGDERRVPVLSCKETTIRRAIGSTRRVPLDRFIADGWLIPVDPAAILNYSVDSTVLDEDKHPGSPAQAPVDSTLLEAEKTEEPTTTAAEIQKTSSPSLNSQPANGNGSGPAAVQAPARETSIREACQRFGADPNIAEPYARQLTAGQLNTIAETMQAKIARGTVERVPAQFVDLLQRQVKANQAAARPTVEIPTLEQNLLDDAVGYALGRHPWEVAQDLLGKKMNRLGVATPEQTTLLTELRAAFDNANAA